MKTILSFAVGVCLLGLLQAQSVVNTTRDPTVVNSNCKLFNTSSAALQQCNNPEFVNITGPKDFLLVDRARQINICKAALQWSGCLRDISKTCPYYVNDNITASLGMFDAHYYTCCGDMGPSKECGADKWSDPPTAFANCKLFNNSAAANQCFSPDLVNITGPKDFLMANRSRQIQICTAGLKWADCVRSIAKDCPSCTTTSITDSLAIFDANYYTCCGEMGPSKECGADKWSDPPTVYANCKLFNNSAAAMQQCSCPDLTNITGPKDFLMVNRSRQIQICAAAPKWADCVITIVKDCPAFMTEKVAADLGMFDANYYTCCAEMGPSKECGGDKWNEPPTAFANCKLFNNSASAMQQCVSPDLVNITGPKDFVLTNRSRQIQICNAGLRWASCVRDVAKNCPAYMTEKAMADLTMFEVNYPPCCGDGGPSKECGGDKWSDAPAAYASCKLFNNSQAAVQQCISPDLANITGPKDFLLTNRSRQIQICSAGLKWALCIRDVAKDCPFYITEGVIASATTFVASYNACCSDPAGPSKDCGVAKCEFEKNPLLALERCAGPSGINVEQATASDLPQVCQQSSQFLICTKNITTGCSEQVNTYVWGRIDTYYRQCCLPTGITPACAIKATSCSQLPCQNGAACNDKGGKIECTCMPGFSGPLCEIDTNECASNPCVSSAACEDQANGYRCVCPVGFNGTRCEQKVNECAGVTKKELKRDEQYCDFYLECESSLKPPVRTRCPKFGDKIQKLFEPISKTCLPPSSFKSLAPKDIVAKCLP